jgi:uncharacterized protein (DUF697 family)
MAFWDTVKEITSRNIRNQANLRFYLGLAGNADAVRRAERVMFGPDATPEQVRAGRELLEPRVAPFSREDLDRLSLCHLVVILADGPSLVQIRPAPTVMVSHPHDLIPTLIEAKPDWRLALARHFPAFRDPVADRLIADVSRVNAEFSILSALPDSIPVLKPWFPAAAGADILMLTKNQALLILRLAAAYGLDIDLKRRAPELMPIIGGAFGWRTAARQLVGLVPGGVGAAVKGSIAFSGTWVTGKAAQHYFRHGERPGREQVRRLYEEAAERAKLVVQKTMDRVRRVPERVEEPKVLPPHLEPEIPEEPERVEEEV